MHRFLRLRAFVPLACLALLAAACGGGYGRPEQPSSQLAFGVEMARRGLWDEALFRFHQAERLEPNNPRVQNNLGVAYEAAGDFDRALEYYQKALKLEPNNRELRANYARFVEFYQGFKPKEGEATTAGTAGPGQPAPAPAESPQPPPPAAPSPNGPTVEEEPPADDRPPL